MDKIIFVCTGNTCRSPMAEKLGQKLAKEKQLNLNIISRGLFVSVEERAHQSAMKTLEAYELSLIDHVATQFQPFDCLGACLVLTMTLQHKKYLQNLYPELSSKIFTIKEYAGQTGDVADPFGRTQEVYDHCAKEIIDLLHIIFDKFQEEPV